MKNIEKENMPLVAAEGEPKDPTQLLLEQLDTLRREYTQRGVIGRRLFGGKTERIQYIVDVGTVGMALFGAITALETEGEGRKKLLQNLKDTLRVLIDVKPDDAQVNTGEYEQFLERVDKYL